jgi:hypothetical protein
LIYKEINYWLIHQRKKEKSSILQLLLKEEGGQKRRTISPSLFPSKRSGHTPSRTPPPFFPLFELDGVHPRVTRQPRPADLALLTLNLAESVSSLFCMSHRHHHHHGNKKGEEFGSNDKNVTIKRNREIGGNVINKWLRSTLKNNL